MAQQTFGWFGWFSTAGFVILTALYLLDQAVATDLWPVPAMWTLVVALLAGIGALALYFGNDPTDSTGRRTSM